MTATEPASDNTLDGHWGSGTMSLMRDNEQKPTKLAFTKTKLQKFLDHAGDQAALIAASGREGWLPTYRNAVMLESIYSCHGSQTCCAEEHYVARLDPLPNRDIVLTRVGSVEANLRHYRQAADLRARANNEWLHRLITRRVALENATKVFQPADGDVKAISDLDGHS
jgi:hypothetical protein